MSRGIWTGENDEGSTSRVNIYCIVLLLLSAIVSYVVSRRPFVTRTLCVRTLIISVYLTSSNIRKVGAPYLVWYQMYGFYKPNGTRTRSWITKNTICSVWPYRKLTELFRGGTFRALIFDNWSLTQHFPLAQNKVKSMIKKIKIVRVKKKC